MCSIFCYSIHSTWAASCFSSLPGECCLWRHSCHLLDGVDSVQLDGGHSHGNDVIFFIFCWIFSNESPSKITGLMAILLTLASSLLSLLTFPPFLWLVDGHALAHITAAASPILWANFAVSDCLLLGRWVSKNYYLLCFPKTCSAPLLGLYLKVHSINNTF